MRILVLDELSAVRLAGRISEKTAIISIVGKGRKGIRFPENGNVVGILHLRLNDVDWGERTVGSGLPPKREDFEGLGEFVGNALRDGVEILLIHCGSGIARSPATASAIAKKYGLWNGYWRKRYYYPNLRVYEAACAELGEECSDDEIRTLYEERKRNSCWNAATPKGWDFEDVRRARMKEKASEERRRKKKNRSGSE